MSWTPRYTSGNRTTESTGAPRPGFCGLNGEVPIVPPVPRPVPEDPPEDPAE